MNNLGMSLGSLQVEVRTSPLTPEQWSDRILNKIIAVSDMAPQPIRDQALSFRESLNVVLIHYIKEIVSETRADMVKTIGNHASNL